MLTFSWFNGKKHDQFTKCFSFAAFLYAATVISRVLLVHSVGKVHSSSVVCQQVVSLSRVQGQIQVLGLYIMAQSAADDGSKEVIHHTKRCRCILSAAPGILHDSWCASGLIL